MPNTNSSLCERKAQDIDLSGVIDCCFRHAIHPEWNMQSDESKNHLFSALKQMKEVYAAEDSVLIDHLMNVCRNPWTLDVVKDVLSGSKGAMTETSNGNQNISNSKIKVVSRLRCKIDRFYTVVCRQPKRRKIRYK